jgi:hypothetical protein
MLGASGAGAGLVAGGSPATDRMERVRVLRPFLIGGERVEVDAEIDVPRRLAIELRTANKAEILATAAAEPAPPDAGNEDGEE